MCDYPEDLLPTIAHAAMWVPLRGFEGWKRPKKLVYNIFGTHNLRRRVGYWITGVLGYDIL